MSGLGSRFPKNVLRELKRLNIYCHSSVSIVFQQKSQRWMIAGEEGGGSVDRLGHYVGYLGVAPEGLAVSIPIQSFIPNRTQRRVFAHDLVRLEIFRYETSCNLTVTRHYLVSPGAGRRSELKTVELFQQRNGILTTDSKQPVFFDGAGEAIDLPRELVPAIQAVSKGVLSQRNKRAHLIGVPDVTLPSVETKKQTEELQPVHEAQQPIMVSPVAIDSEKQVKGRRRATKSSAA
jgi:hypothetical protein